jgi:hypothetical protein
MGDRAQVSSCHVISDAYGRVLCAYYSDGVYVHSFFTV